MTAPRVASGPPVTRSQLASGFGRLDLPEGGTVLVHTSLSALGNVVGGAVAVCEALRLAAGPTATLVMPGFTPQLVHPGAWRPERRHGVDPQRLADEMPLFDPASTPVARTVGAVPDCFRTQPGTRRSGHPHVSFLAQGPRAATVTGAHPAAWRFSAQGPLGRLADLEASVLLVGTSWSTCTALHLAEYAAEYPGRRWGYWPVPTGTDDRGRTVWTPVPELLVWEGDFARLGEDAERAVPVRRGRVGEAECRLVGLRELVTFATDWLRERRDLTALADPPGWSRTSPATGRLPGTTDAPAAPGDAANEHDGQESAA